MDFKDPSRGADVGDRKRDGGVLHPEGDRPGDGKDKEHRLVLRKVGPGHKPALPGGFVRCDLCLDREGADAERDLRQAELGFRRRRVERPGKQEKENERWKAWRHVPPAIVPPLPAGQP